MNRYSPSLKTKLYSFFGVAIFGFIMWRYALEIHWMQNTIDLGKLLVIFLILGIVFGVLIAIKLTKNTKDTIDKVRIYAALISVGMIFMPFFGSFTNRSLSFKSVENQSFELIKETPFAEERFGIIKDQEVRQDGYYIFIVVDNRPFRIESKHQLFPEKERGEMVEVPIRKGLFGFDVVWVE